MKRITSLILALVIMLSCAFGTGFDALAEKMYAEDKIEEIQKQSGFVPGKTSIVTGNCYAFVSAVCEKLFGTKYQEELYNGYQCKHKTGKFYEVALLKTSNDMNEANMKKIINFFRQNAMPGDVVHYGSLSNSSSTHTFMIQSIDDTKMRIFHSNYSTREYASSTCHIDTIYWKSLRENPTQSVYNSDGTMYSHNSLFYNKMRYSGMGVTINRYTNYNKLYYPIGAESTVPPTLSATRLTPTSIKISWNAVTAASKYYVVYKEKSESGYHVLASGWKTTSMEVKYLKVGTKYCFKVRAYAAGKWMDYSDVLTVKAMPPKVGSAKIKPADKGMSIKWAKKDGLSGVKIYRSTSKDGKYSLIATLDRASSDYTDTKVKYGNTYYYKIERFVNAYGNTYSMTSNPFEGKYVLAKPNLIFDRIDSSSVKVTASGDGCQTNFVYHVKSKGKTVQAQKSTKDSAFTISSLTLGEEYTVYVAEKTSLGQGEYGEITFTALPKEVTNVKSKQVTDGIKVTFDTQSNIDGYRVYRSTSEEGTYGEIADLSASAKSYIDTSVKMNKAYYYKVKSYKKSGSARYFGECPDASDAAKYVLPATSKIVATNASPSRIKVSWKRVKFAKTYTLSYKEKGGNWQTVENIKNKTYTVKNLTVGKVYYFRVRGVSDIGKGSYVKKIKLKARPATPEAPKTKVKKNGIKLSFKTKSYASQYMIYRADKKNGRYYLISTIQGNKTKTYLDKNVRKGRTYYYRLVCCYTKDGVTHKSEKSKTVKQKY